MANNNGNIIQKAIITPFQKFINIESMSGMLLFGATVVALVVANTPLGSDFKSFWQFKIGISTSGFELVKPLLLWVNDGLMAIFFFLIGLEIKRELMIGELNSAKKASFPLFAAVGGMVIPVGLFFALNRDPETAHAWGIPMATDIAFSLAILRLLGNRVPIGLKVFLTAFAIVDDLGAVLVIAVFYSGTIKWMLVAIALGLVVILFFMTYFGDFYKLFTLAVGIVVWYLFLKAGIHPTIAGVLMAFTVPIRQTINMGTYIDKLSGIVDNIKQTRSPKAPLLSGKQIQEIDNLEDWTNKVQSPLQHLEHKLHNWVAFLIMPVFALSNAAVELGGDTEMNFSLSLTIMISLVVGKLVGISLFSWLGVRFRMAEYPTGVSFLQLVGVALLAGVGFTMSIFVANLAFFEQPALLDSAKIGILVGSVVAGLSGFIMLRICSVKGC